MTYDTKPTITERLSSASNTSDLTVQLERRGDVDVLIAAGLSSHQIGRYLDQLVSEWDACTPPRRLRADDIRRLAEHMPAVQVKGKGGKVRLELDLAGANAEAQRWLNGERRRVVGRLKTLPKLMDPHAGVIPWMTKRGIPDPAAVLLDVLGWYLDRRCPACNGTKWEVVAGSNRQSNKACTVCKGIGDRELPHERHGRDVVEYLTRSADKARSNAKDVLRNMRHLKHVAAGKV